MSRVDRLFAITLLLQHKKRLRAADLARVLEVSERTIYRDIESLNAGGVPVVSLPGQGYTLMEGYYLPPLTLTPAEARGLFLAGRMLEAHSKGQLLDELGRALIKVGLVLPESTRAEAERLGEVVQFFTPKQPIDFDEPHLVLLWQALREKRVVRLSYHGRNSNQPTQREVEPHGLNYAEGVWYLDGYCRLRRGLRGFRLERIDHLEVTDERFERRELKAPTVRTFTAQIRFRPDVVRWVRERQHYSFQTERSDSDGVVMTYLLGDFEEIKGWLLGWGAAAEPLTPPELRQMVWREVQGMLEQLT